MRRHIVRPLGLVRVARPILRRDALEKGGKIPLHVRIGVFLHEQRGEGVSAEQRQQAGRDRLTKAATSRVISTRPLPRVSTRKWCSAWRISSTIPKRCRRL
jgi:hypothetical protein